MYILTPSFFQGKIYAGLRYEYNITLQHVFREEDKESERKVPQGHSRKMEHPPPPPAEKALVKKLVRNSPRKSYRKFQDLLQITSGESR
jgi:hypothetical protein